MSSPSGKFNVDNCADANLRARGLRPCCVGFLFFFSFFLQGLRLGQPGLTNRTGLPARNYVIFYILNQACTPALPPAQYILNTVGMTSNQNSVPELVTIDQAQQIVRVHLAGHDQCIVKSLSQIENKGYRQVYNLWIRRSRCP